MSRNYSVSKIPALITYKNCPIRKQSHNNTITTIRTGNNVQNSQHYITTIQNSKSFPYVGIIARYRLSQMTDPLCCRLGIENTDSEGRVT